jgi:hypothetical protein
VRGAARKHKRWHLRRRCLCKRSCGGRSLSLFLNVSLLREMTALSTEEDILSS